MTPNRAAQRRALCAVALCLLLSACIVKVRRAEVEPLRPDTRAWTVVESPVKAHLLSGATIVYPMG